MADREPTKAHRSQRALHFATIYNDKTWGLVLGDLRKLVTAADGIPDDAEVIVEDLRKHYSRIDEYLAKRITVRAELKAEETS